MIRSEEQQPHPTPTPLFSSLLSSPPSREQNTYMYFKEMTEFMAYCTSRRRIEERKKERKRKRKEREKDERRKSREKKNKQAHALAIFAKYTYKKKVITDAHPPSILYAWG